MARPKRISPSDVDSSNPKFFTLDPDNPNTNISAAKFDPTDPTLAEDSPWNKFLQTANVGDTFDWYKETGDATQKGVSSTFAGFNQMGTPIIQTNITEERADWRKAISGAGTSYSDKMNALMNTGRSETESRFLLAQYFGPEYVAANAPKNKPVKEPVGVLADGTPFYGWDAKGNPVTSPTGAIYSTTSSTDAITKANSGFNPITTANTSGNTSFTTLSTKAAEDLKERESAFNILYNEMDAIGLGALVTPLRSLITQDVSPSEFAIKLRESDAYKMRFAANEVRQKKGLRVLTPGEYLRVEDAYRQTLRAYGLKQFDNDAYVRQFIENDISAAELSDRVALAVQRVQNADPAIARTLRDYYGIGQTDLVAYVLDPNQQAQKIQRQVAAAEIGTAARRQGIEPGVGVAEQLAAQGISQAEAQRGYATIADILPTTEKLSQIYGATLEEYDLSQAEQEVFNQLASAQRRRERLTQREMAEFSGRSGLARGGLTETQTRGQF